MASIKLPELKALILDILLNTDDIDDKGTITRRSRFNINYQRGYNGLKKLIVEGMEIGVGTPEQKDQSLQAGGIPVSELTWMLNKDFVLPEGLVVIAERQTEAELELTDKMVQALKYYKADREELPMCSDACLDALDELLTGKIPSEA